MSVIQITDLNKQYGSTVALRGVDLTIEENEVFSLVGPNGAGKSTLMDIILDYTRANSGDIRIFGNNPRTDAVEIHRQVGVLPQGYDVYPGLTAHQHLEYAIDTNDATDNPEVLLDRVALGNVSDRYPSEFSRGMTQRLVLAMALVGDPALLVLDEPFSGIDPNGMRLIRSIIYDEVDRGATVLLSSHDLSNVREVSTRIGILTDGRLVATGTEHQLCSNAPVTTVFSIDTHASEPQRRSVVSLDSVTGIERRNGNLVVRASDSTAQTQIREQLEAPEIRTNNPTLDDVFAYYTVDDATTSQEIDQS